MIFMINLLLSIYFIFLNHPMSMGLTLLIQTIIICMITGMLNINFWFSYILFLIMVGGMLILFIYMTSIASNEMFIYSNQVLLFFLLIFMFVMIFFIIIDNYMLNLNNFYLENILLKNNFLSLTKYFNYPSMNLIFFMIIYLFITLIAIVKITKIEFGPLRQKY